MHCAHLNAFLRYYYLLCPSVLFNEECKCYQCLLDVLLKRELFLQVDVGGEELVTISSGVESYFQDDTTLEEHLLTRKGARKALIDAMTSDEDE